MFFIRPIVFLFLCILEDSSILLNHGPVNMRLYFYGWKTVIFWYFCFVQDSYYIKDKINSWCNCWVYFQEI